MQSEQLVPFFTVAPRETNNVIFTYSRRVTAGAEVLGVVVVEVDLQKFERAWSGISAAVLVTDSASEIILTTEPRWRGLTEDDALARQTPQNAIARALRATTDWTAFSA